MTAQNVGGLLRETARRLSEAGNDNPRFEAEQLVMKMCGITRNDMLMFPQLAVTEQQLAEAQRLIERRLSGEPLQYILGEWEFYGLPFYVGEGVLIPRQDTETIAELALEYIKAHRHYGFIAADLCAGSGCIGITLAKLAGINLKLLELSEQAMAYLRRNIVLNGVSGLCEDVSADVLLPETAASLPKLDLIVTNPPYLTAQDMQKLQTEVRFEPETALFGGVDGLDYYRRMLPLWSGRLKPGGMIAAEIGEGQEADVMRIFEENGIAPQYKKDLCGVVRVIYGINSMEGK